MKSIQRVVAVDTEAAVLERLRAEIGASNVQVDAFRSVDEALAFIEKGAGDRAAAVDVVVCSVQMPEIEAGRFVRGIKELNPETPILALADFQSLARGVDWVNPGAFSYLLKPLSSEELVATLRKIDELRSYESNSQQLDDEIARKEGHCFGMVGSHPLMRQLFDRIRKAGQLPPRTSILIEGESGTGKELVARAIHQLGSPGEPFIAVNCGAINANLLEDQLFGRLRGAFTGAESDRDGFFVAAGRGTVFLDEIGELPHELQAKLLRATQEREVIPLGADRPVPWHARLIVATNRDLRELIQSRSFRKDLYYRISAIRIDVPPLRKRLTDVPLLAEYFINRLSRESKKRKRLSERALEVLTSYDFPGNVRELQNAIEYAFVLGPDVIGPADLPRELQAREVEVEQFRPLADVERAHIVNALRMAGGKKVQAARFLQIDRNRLYRLIQKYGIEPSEIHR